MSNGPITIVREIPARREAITVLWCKQEFCRMDQDYRDIRAKAGSKKDTCFLCGHKFDDGEWIGLAGVAKKPNQVVCQGCIETHNLCDHDQR